MTQPSSPHPGPTEAGPGSSGLGGGPGSTASTGTQPPRDVASAKAALRTRSKAVRAAIEPTVRARASGTISDTVVRLAVGRGARTVVCYAALGDEVDSDPAIGALLDRGIRVALPRVSRGRLVLASVTDLDAHLATGRFGIREPLSDRPVLDPADVDLFVVPGLAFDRSGHRLGYGGSFYDRLLRGRRDDALVAAVAFADQLVDAVPAEPHDHPVDCVVTESGVVGPDAALVPH